MRAVVLSLTAALVALLTAAPAAAAPVVAAVPTGCAAPTGVYRGSTPWPQLLLQPARSWPIADGTGTTVAVIGTGIDATNPQFAPGQVLPARSLIGAAAGDCDGRGTVAAGLVGAQRVGSTTFTGIAPGARLLPIRYTQSTADGADSDPTLLAQAIGVAVAAHADVALVAVPTATDNAALQAAVTAARAAGTLVVAPASATDAGARSYPAADAGALGVAGRDQSGAPVAAEAGDWIALAAPAGGLVSTSAGGAGQVWPVNDAADAAAFVAGAAAVLKSHLPGITAAQLVARLTLTADRPGTTRDPRLGWGTVDLQAALTAPLGLDAAGPGAPAATPPARVVAAAPPAVDAAANRSSGLVALLVLLGAVVVALGAVAVRRGRG